MKPAELKAYRHRLAEATPEQRDEILQHLAMSASGGDELSLEELLCAVSEFKLAHSPIRRYLLADADIDIVESRVLLKILTKIDTFRAESKFTTWLYTIAGNEAKQHLREEYRHVSRAETSDPNWSKLKAGAGTELVTRVSSLVVNAQTVEDAIETLPVKLRNALCLREQQGFTYEEIATQLDVPLSTAKTWVRRGRAELAKSFLAN